MVLFPKCKCCSPGPFKCYTDGTDYQCVGPGETPPAGWTTDGTEYATKKECEAACYKPDGPYRCFTNGTGYQCVGNSETPPDGWVTDNVQHETREECEAACVDDGPYRCWKDRYSPVQICLGVNETPPRDYFWDGVDHATLRECEDSCNNCPCLCYTDGLYAKCVDQTETPPFGWTTDGVGHGSPWECQDNCAGLWPDPCPTIDDVDYLELVSMEVSGIKFEGMKNGSDIPPANTDYADQITNWVQAVTNVRHEPALNGSLIELTAIGAYDWCVCEVVENNPLFNPLNTAGYLAGSRYIDTSCLETGANFVTTEATGFYTCGQWPRMDIEGRLAGSPSCLQEYGFLENQGVVIRFGGSASNPLAMDMTRLEQSITINDFGQVQFEVYNDRFPDGPFFGIMQFSGQLTMHYKLHLKGGNTRSTKMPPAQTGPGTELASLLKRFGIHAKEKGCGCRSMQRKMDAWGPEGCRRNMEAILKHLAQEARKRGLPFLKIAAKKLVNTAISRAEKKT